MWIGFRVPTNLLLLEFAKHPRQKCSINVDKSGVLLPKIFVSNMKQIDQVTDLSQFSQYFNHLIFKETYSTLRNNNYGVILVPVCVGNDWI